MTYLQQKIPVKKKKKKETYIILSVSFEIPEGLNSSRMPIWSGKILIKANNGEQLSVFPYFGTSLSTLYSPKVHASEDLLISMIRFGEFYLGDGASIEHALGGLFSSNAGFPQCIIQTIP